MGTENKLVYSKENYYTENGYKYKIKTTISLDDDCHNNMCDWSITADIRWKNKYGIYKEYMGGCCPYELALKLHELGVNSESEFYFVKEMKGGETQIDSVVQNTMRYSYRKEGDLIPAYMSHELGEILPSMINVSKSKIWDEWLQLTQYFPNRDSRYYEAAYVRYNAYDSPTEVYSGFGETEAESRAMLLFDLLEKKILTPDSLNLKEVDRRKEYENEFE